MKQFLIILALMAAFEAAIFNGAYAAEVEVQPRQVSDLKAVYGQVFSRDVVPARARIAGTVEDLRVEQGSLVKAGEVIAIVADRKLALQMQAVDAKITSLEAEVTNARAELARAETLLGRGVTTRQQVDLLRTRLEVVTGQKVAALSEQAVVKQRMSEGSVEAPTNGRIVEVPVTLSSVIMAGETIAQVAGGGFYLRLSLPERHAALLREGLNVAMLGRPAQLASGQGTAGRIVKIYPQLTGGQVIADVEADGLDNFYLGERALVRLPVASRLAIIIPSTAVKTRAGIDFVTIRQGDGTRDVSVIAGMGRPAGEIEILSGLAAGDVVVVP